MKLTNRNAQRLLIALRNLEASGEIKFKGQTRIDIAKNINLLMPNVGAFETGSQKRELDYKDDTPDQNRAIKKELIDLADATQDYDLVPLAVADLDLDSNHKITGEQIAALAPILAELAKAA